MWQKTHNNITYTPVISGMAEGWQGRKGLVHQAVMEDFSDLSTFEVYACGSAEMIRAAKVNFLKLALIEENFFSDAFTPSKQSN